MAKSRHMDWLRQAREDLSWGKDTFKSGYFAQTCFIAQQVAEESLRALAFSRDYSSIRVIL